MRRFLALSFFLHTVVAFSGELTGLDVELLGDDYRLTLDARIDAPLDFVFATFTDYDRLTRLSPAIRESRIVEHVAPGVERLRTRTRLCVLFICRTMLQVQDMRATPPGAIDAHVLDHGDFHGGEAVWRYGAEGDATRLRFEARLTPAFWVPPIIGPLVIHHVLVGEAERTIEGFERLYRERP